MDLSENSISCQRKTSTQTSIIESGTNSSGSSSHLEMHEEIIDIGEPSFCHIIHDCILKHGEITIPQGFVREYGDDFDDYAILTVPNGKEWFVEMNSSDGVVYFNKGLKKFFETYSITSGYFLVFKYQGNFHFSVLIFQMSADEIDYSSFDNYPGETSSKTNATEQQEASGETDNDPEDDSDEEDCESVGADITRKKKHMRITAGGVRTHEAAVEVEKSFKSANNYPFFTVGLQPSYVAHKFLPVPSDFEEKEKLKKLKNITLKVVPDNGGGSWTVYLATSVGRGQGIRFSKGVAKFLKDNNLKQGDVCVFEMVTKKKSSCYEYSNVHIYRS